MKDIKLVVTVAFQKGEFVEVLGGFSSYDADSVGVSGYWLTEETDEMMHYPQGTAWAVFSRPRRNQVAITVVF